MFLLLCSGSERPEAGMGGSRSRSRSRYPGRLGPGPGPRKSRTKQQFDVPIEGAAMPNFCSKSSSMSKKTSVKLLKFTYKLAPIRRSSVLKEKVANCNYIINIFDQDSGNCS